MPVFLSFVFPFSANVFSIVLMMPKCSPVRYTIPALEQPMPENKKAQRKAFKGGSGVEPAKYPPKVKSENALTTLEC